MKIFYMSFFLRKYRKLPDFIQDAAEEKEKIFRQNPFDPRLKMHKLKGRLGDYWSFSVNYEYRIICEFIDSETVCFHSIGDHDVYR